MIPRAGYGNCSQGTGEFTVGGIKHQVKAGEALIMPLKSPMPPYTQWEAFKNAHRYFPQ